MNKAQIIEVSASLMIIEKECKNLGVIARQLLDAALDTNNPAESLRLDHKARTIARVAVTIKQVAVNLHTSEVKA